MESARLAALLQLLRDSRSRRALIRLALATPVGVVWRQTAEARHHHHHHHHHKHKRHRKQNDHCPATCPLCQECVNGKACTTVADGTVCNGTGTCAQGTCTCVPACTAGCCQDGTCVPGTTEAACGEIGQTCSTCKGGQPCDRGICLDTCSAVISAVPPATATLTVQDNFGVFVITVIRSDNANTPVPPFTAGTTSPITVTSTKIDQSQPATVVLQIQNGADGLNRCGVVF